MGITSNVLTTGSRYLALVDIYLPINPVVESTRSQEEYANHANGKITTKHT